MLLEVSVPHMILYSYRFVLSYRFRSFDLNVDKVRNLLWIGGIFFFFFGDYTIKLYGHIWGCFICITCIIKALLTLNWIFFVFGLFPICLCY